MSLLIEDAKVPLRMDADAGLRVGSTRVTLDSVIASFEQGACPEEILEHYPSLRLADIYAVIAFYLTHREQVDAYLASRREEGEKLRREYELKHDHGPFHERLLARKRDLER